MHRSPSSSAKLRGVIPPIVTPLLAPDTLDCAGLERLIEHILAGGVHGIFVLGTTGEAPSLSYRLRAELIRRTTQQVAGRVPVLVGITDSARAESLNVARISADAGANAVVIAPPYYFPAGQPELSDYFVQLSRELPLPAYLYNMPVMTKTVIGADIYRRALEEPNIIGAKDSSGDLVYFSELAKVARARPDWALFVGAEAHMRQSLPMGSDGTVSGGANVFPRLFVELFEACERGDEARANALQSMVDQLQQLYGVGRHISSGIKGIKCALDLAGICRDVMAAPFERFNEPERRRVAELIETFADFPGRPLPSVVSR